MPRAARARSITNVYHVTLRGINRQDIFEEKSDHLEFLRILECCKKISGFELYAYCLMSDHVHMLIKTDTEEIDLVMKRITIRYAIFYNRKYRRIGHLFQNRYGSEKVENEQYLKTAWRYILQNPMKAGMEKTPGHYKWSSIAAYLGTADTVTDSDFINGMFPDKEEMLSFLNCPNEDVCLDIEKETVQCKTDEAAFIIMQNICHCSSTAEFQRMNKEEKKTSFVKLKKQGLSVRQINRITGANRRTIAQAIRQAETQEKCTRGT